MKCRLEPRSIASFAVVLCALHSLDGFKASGEFDGTEACAAQEEIDPNALKIADREIAFGLAKECSIQQRMTLLHAFVELKSKLDSDPGGDPRARYEKLELETKVEFSGSLREEFNKLSARKDCSTANWNVLASLLEIRFACPSYCKFSKSFQLFMMHI